MRLVWKAWVSSTCCRGSGFSFPQNRCDLLARLSSAKSAHVNTAGTRSTEYASVTDLPADRKRSPQGLSGEGAVLFGHSWKFPLRWKKAQQAPEAGELEDNLEAAGYLSPVDSGIESSLSSSGGGQGSSSLQEEDTAPTGSLSPGGSEGETSSVERRATLKEQSEVEATSTESQAALPAPLGEVNSEGPLDRSIRARLMSTRFWWRKG